jgi:hypothetical protein
MTDRRNFLLGAAALGTLGHPLGALAQANLELASIICGFPPGGTSDAISRRIADKLRGGYATNVVVDNKPGAGGQIGVTTLRDSPADGSAMLLTPSSMLSIYPFVYKNLPYKPLEDVQPVSLACYFNHAFGVGPAVPESVKTVKDFLAWAKANPDQGQLRLARRGLHAAPDRGPAQQADGQRPEAHPLPRLGPRHPGPAGRADFGHVVARGRLPSLRQDRQACACWPSRASTAARLCPTSPPTASRASRSPCASGTACSCPARPTRQRWCAAPPPTCSRHWPSPTWWPAWPRSAWKCSRPPPQVLGDLLKADAEEWRRLIKQIGFTAESPDPFPVPFNLQWRHHHEQPPSIHPGLRRLAPCWVRCRPRQPSPRPWNRSRSSTAFPAGRYGRRDQPPRG